MPIATSLMLRPAQRLPRSEATWQLVDDPDGVVIVDLGTGDIRFQRLMGEELDEVGLVAAVRESMMRPPEGQSPQRPRRMELVDEVVASWLGKALRMIGVQVELVEEVDVAEAVLDDLMEERCPPLPADCEVTVTDVAPKWLRTKVGALLAEGADTPALAAAPLVFVWAPNERVPELLERLPKLRYLSPPDEAPVDEDAGTAGAGEARRSDDVDDIDTSLWLVDQDDRVRLVDHCSPETLAPLDAAATAQIRGLMVIAERHATQPLPAFERLCAAWTVEIVAIDPDDGDEAEDEDSGDGAEVGRLRS